MASNISVLFKWAVMLKTILGAMGRDSPLSALHAEERTNSISYSQR